MCGRRKIVTGICEIVYPSGLAPAAMLAGPLVPEPPVRLSMITG